MVFIASYFVASPSFQNSQPIDVESDDWLSWAEIAWRYFQPGVGVHHLTGLNHAKKDWHRITDWDLGGYILAIIDAEKLNLVSSDGVWGSDYRLEKVLSFLEERPITDGRLPYAFYDSDTGVLPLETPRGPTNPPDTGRLLIALDELRRFRPDLASRISEVVRRYDYNKLADSSFFAVNDLYPHYVAQGFHSFGFETPNLKDVRSLGDGQFVEVYGEKMPRAWVTPEPLIHGLFEIRTSRLGFPYRGYAHSVYRVQLKRYADTGVLTAFSEGSYPEPHYYVYEWVVTGAGEEWAVFSGNSRVNGAAMVYTKIAFAYHALYKDEYTKELMNYISDLTSPEGFYEGRLDDGEAYHVLSDKTNAMILEAARFAVEYDP